MSYDAPGVDESEGESMAKFETVPIGELKHRLPAKLLPLVEEYREKMEKLTAEQGGRLTLEKGDDPKELRRALKAAAAAVNRRVRFPFRGEEGSLSFYLEGKRGRRGLRPKGEIVPDRKRRGRPRKGEFFGGQVKPPQPRLLSGATRFPPADGGHHRVVSGWNRTPSGPRERICQPTSPRTIRFALVYFIRSALARPRTLTGSDAASTSRTMRHSRLESCTAVASARSTARGIRACPLTST
jgi:hypothetical protein